MVIDLFADGDCLANQRYRRMTLALNQPDQREVGQRLRHVALVRRPGDADAVLEACGGTVEVAQALSEPAGAAEGIGPKGYLLRPGGERLLQPVAPL